MTTQRLRVVTLLWIAAAPLLPPAVHAFSSAPPAAHPRRRILRCDRVQLHAPPLSLAATRHGPEQDKTSPTTIHASSMKAVYATLERMAAPLAAAVLVCLVSTAAWAADFAKKDISGMDFSGQDLSNKDFTSTVAKNTNFHNANLQGAIFKKADLSKADFSGANVKLANFVDAALDGANFKNAVAERATFSASILDIGYLENVDLTDSMWPSKYSFYLYRNGSPE